MRFFKSTSRRVALSFVFLLPVIWGTTFPLIKIALLDGSPMVFAAARFGVAGLLFMLISRDARHYAMVILRPRSIPEFRLRRDVLILGMSLAIGYIFQTAGLLTTTASKSAFLTSTTIIWTPLIAIVSGKERLHVKLALAIAVTLIGIVLLTHPFEGEGFVVGDILTLSCAVSFSVYIAWVDNSIEHTVQLVGEENRAALVISALQVLVAGILILLAIPLFENPRLHFTGNLVGAVIYTGIMATGLAAFLQNRYQKSVKPTVAALIFMLEPVVAVLVSYIFLREILGTQEVLGALLIIGGVILVQIPFGTGPESALASHHE